MSQLSESVSQNTLRRDVNHYFDQNMNIWYSDGVAVRTVYLAPLRDQVTIDEIFDYCSGFGKVEEVRIHKEATQSFGCVTFQQPDSATKALMTQLHTIGGHQAIFSIANRVDDEKQQANEITTSSGTVFTDLNDDCLYEIFSMLSLMDLCSIARTSTRFTGVCNEMFTKKYKICDLQSITKTIYEARRIIVTFGPLLSELLLLHGGHISMGSQSSRLLHLATRCCGDTLESLTLDSILIPKWLAFELRPLLNRLQTLHFSSCALVGVDHKYVFPNCESLVQLQVTCENSGIDKFILENTFPKLERFKLNPQNTKAYSNLIDFFSRHQNLKSLTLEYCTPSVLLNVAQYCRQLEEFEFRLGYTHWCCKNDYEESFKSLLNLPNLRNWKTNNYREIWKMFQLWDARFDTVSISAPKLSKYTDYQLLEISDRNGNLKIGCLTDRLKNSKIVVALLSQQDFDDCAMCARCAVVNGKFSYIPQGMITIN